MKKLDKKDYLLFACSFVLVTAAVLYNQKIQAENAIYFPRSLSDQDMKLYANADLNAVIIYPIFTDAAYKKGGFYDYYNKTCSTCSTVSLKPLIVNATYVSGSGGFNYLTQLHYSYITDIMVDQDPAILDKYDKIILLHNEYMTLNEFNAIKNHKNVIYLYPNSAYVQISADYNTNTISLVRGHGYPQANIMNGFNYTTSSKYEYDLKCQNYHWAAEPNGMQPTCWPEFLIKSDRNILQTIKDYPLKVPNLVHVQEKNINITGLCKLDQAGNCISKILN